MVVLVEGGRCGPHQEEGPTYGVGDPQEKGKINQVSIDIMMIMLIIMFWGE